MPKNIPAKYSKTLLPREKLNLYGVENLTNPELLALILRSGSAAENVFDLSSKIAKKLTPQFVESIQLSSLEAIGLNGVKASSLLAALELGKRLHFGNKKTDNIIDSTEAAALEFKHLHNKQKEYFEALFLDARNNLILKEVISIGTLDSTLVHPRELFEPALKNRCAYIIIAHNHPTGNLTPSPEDLELTKQLHAAGQLLGIKLIDHLIIGGGEYVSIIDQALEAN